MCFVRVVRPDNVSDRDATCGYDPGGGTRSEDSVPYAGRLEEPTDPLRPDDTGGIRPGRASVTSGGGAEQVAGEWEPYVKSGTFLKYFFYSRETARAS